MRSVQNRLRLPSAALPTTVIFGAATTVYLCLAAPGEAAMISNIEVHGTHRLSEEAVQSNITIVPNLGEGAAGARSGGLTCIFRQSIPA